MKLKVTVLGTRGIPNVRGGVETHCQNLYPEIYQQNHADICVIARSPYVDYRRSEYKGVRLKACGRLKAASSKPLFTNAGSLQHPV